MTTAVMSKEAFADYNVVGEYQQDLVNGLTEQLIDRMLDAMCLEGTEHILDAMAGDGNLSERIVAYCNKRKIECPKITILEYSSAQCEYASLRKIGQHVAVMNGDILTMSNLVSGERLEDHTFDRVIIKSANHEIPRRHQQTLYNEIYRVLKPGGMFVNLGFLFDDASEQSEFRELCRVKDHLAGMTAAEKNRYLCLRGELYEYLFAAGFSSVEPVSRFNYAINTYVGVSQYFHSPEDIHRAFLELQATQARSLTMRRKGHIQFVGDQSIMMPPGEVTRALKPTIHAEPPITERSYARSIMSKLRCHNELLDHAVSLLTAQEQVLDMGCGPGLLAGRLSTDTMYHGVDVSHDHIAYCRKRFVACPNFSFEQADLNDIAFLHDEYDAVVALNVLHLPSMKPVTLLKKAYYSLKSNGRILVSGPLSAESFELIQSFIEEQLKDDHLWDDPDIQLAFEKLVAMNKVLVSENGHYWSAEGMIELLNTLGYDGQVLTYMPIYYGQGYLVSKVKS